MSVTSPDIVWVSPAPEGAPAAASVGVPGSKSVSHRLHVLAMLSGGATRIEGAGTSTDTRTLEAALARLDERRGVGATLDAKDGGAPARFLLAAAAVTPGTWTITGTARLRSRPMAPLLRALAELGAPIDRADHLPVTIEGGRIGGGEVGLDASSSSQLLSALLLAAPALPRGLVVRARGLVSRPYVDMTLEALAAFGVDFEETAGEGGERVFAVQPGLAPPAAARVPADAASAGYFWTLGAIGGPAAAVDVDPDTRQADLALLPALESLGAAVHRSGDGIRVVGPLRRGGRIDVRDAPDSAPSLAVAAAFAPEAVEIVGAPHLRLKESDRIVALTEGLEALGVAARPLAGGLRVEGAARDVRPGVRVSTHGDHRVAMAFSLFGAHVRVGIRNPACCAKSFPGFFDALGGLLRVEPRGGV